MSVVSGRGRLPTVDDDAADAGGDWTAGALPAWATVVGLYVHFPFCSVRCPYCDFAVDDRPYDSIPHDVYADAVEAEILARAPHFPRPLASIYFGGGTPGLWRSDALARVIAAARAAFHVASDADLEVTVEANPGEVNERHLAALRAAGVNRLSLGVQAVDDGALISLGRNHRAVAAAEAMQIARIAGFDNVSIDLMFGLPGQSQDDWNRTLEVALSLQPEHVSAYALTIERGTAFGARARRGEIMAAPDDEVAAMQARTRQVLATAGFSQYEVSSYARSNRAARHNSLYWVGEPYLGVGASAASFRPLEGGGAWRFANPRATATYLNAVTRGGRAAPSAARAERLDADECENEAVWLGLRTSAGIDRCWHALRFGRDPLLGREDGARRMADAGWIEIGDSHVRPIGDGLLFADEIAVRLWR